MCCDWPSGTPGRPKTTSGAHGTSYERRRDADRYDQRHPRARDRGGVRRGVRADGARRLGGGRDEFLDAWYESRATRETGGLRDYLATLGADAAVADEIATLRHESTRTMLVPRPGAVETLVELRARGLKLGLIS